MRHTYGQEDSGDEGEGNLVRDVGEMIGNEDEVTLISGRKCRCRSTTRSRTSHRSCSLNKTEVASLHAIFIAFMYGKSKRDEWQLAVFKQSIADKFIHIGYLYTRKFSICSESFMPKL